MIAKVPPSVLIFLDLNVPMSSMFQIPALITMTIAATRIYRSLVDYASSDGTISHSAAASGRGGHKVSDLRFRSAPVPPTRTDVSVRTERNEYETTQTSCNSSTPTDAYGGYKVNGVGLIADVESGLEK